MAHTLTIYDTQSATSIDLASATTPGIVLHAPGGFVSATPLSEYARANSIYTDGEFIKQGRQQNVIETIVVDIHGSSADNAAAQLRTLTQALEQASDQSRTNSAYTRKELRFKPQSSTNTAAAIIVSGKVTLPGTYLDAEIVSNVITGVILTIEREPNWRATSGTYHSASGTGVGTVSITGAEGDIYNQISALKFRPNTTTSTNLIGYAAKSHYQSNHSQLGPRQAESADTLGTDTTSAADAAAYSGNVASVSFATVATMTARTTWASTTAANCIYNSVRVLARVKVGAATTCGLRAVMRGAESGGTFGTTYIHYITGNTVTVTNTAFRWIDLGAFVVNASKRFVVPQLQASRTSGANTLSIDTMFLLPTAITLKFGAATAANSDSLYYSNEGGIPFFGETIFKTNGDLRIPPGDGTLYWVSGNANFEDVTTDTTNIEFTRWPMYLTARGAT